MRQDNPPSPLSLPPRGSDWILIGLGLFALGIGTALAWNNPLVGWSEIPNTFAGLGVGLIGVGILFGRVHSWICLVLASTFISVFFAFALSALMGVNPYRVYRDLRMRVSSPSVGIWRYDSRLGYANRPGIEGLHETPYLKATYTIDDRGCRITPDPENSKGEILFLGCSFTFGLGVENEDSFPYQLGAKYWTDYKIYNLSTPGWGTAQAYLNLLGWLASPPYPKLVFYGWIPPHKSRNYIRGDWVKHLGRPWNSQESEFLINHQRRHPHFEVRDGGLEFLGTIGPEEVGEDPPNLLEKEVALTQAFIREMVFLCREKEVPFVFLNLPVTGGEGDDLPDFVSEVLEESGALYLDTRAAFRGVIGGDGHPNAETYSALADLIGSARIVSEVLGSSGK